jgi:hypothetical protein
MQPVPGRQVQGAMAILRSLGRYFETGRSFWAGVLAFVSLGFVFRLLSNYTREGNIEYSTYNALFWTVTAAVFFIGFARLFRLRILEGSRSHIWLNSIVPSALYTALFLLLYMFVSNWLRLTLKFQGAYLVVDGQFTRHGVIAYLAIAVLDCMFSVMSLVICFPRSEFVEY